MSIEKRIQNTPTWEALGAQLVRGPPLAFRSRCDLSPASSSPAPGSVLSTQSAQALSSSAPPAHALSNKMNLKKKYCYLVSHS